ncbi:MAG: type II toxin-antitoxin system prevent-host-death family antitoxin [Acidobacteriaceae bacterium]
MIEIGAFDARDQFSRLLDQVQQGEEVVITRRGKPVAKLVPDGASPAHRHPETKQLWKQNGEHEDLAAAIGNSH